VIKGQIIVAAALTLASTVSLQQIALDIHCTYKCLQQLLHVHVSFKVRPNSFCVHLQELKNKSTSRLQTVRLSTAAYKKVQSKERVNAEFARDFKLILGDWSSA